MEIRWDNSVKIANLWRTQNSPLNRNSLWYCARKGIKLPAMLTPYNKGESSENLEDLEHKFRTNIEVEGEYAQPLGDQLVVITICN